MEGKRENIFLLQTEVASLVRWFIDFGYCPSDERSINWIESAEKKHVEESSTGL
jgi:hypothetical protein